MEEDHYMILGLSPDATEEEITRAYRRMALIYHPDKNRHPQTVAYFRKVRAAYDVLSDTDSRDAYDRSLRRRASASNRQVVTHQQQQQQQRQQSAQVESPDLFPTICAVGGVLVGLFLGFGAFKTFYNSTSGNK
ncbi:chaperone protein DnaJ [Drosophila ficusphila]|uniref:chaperone protein DnaJ n=1 Tax=Drosophila ficusphila TaxID=30025 RepID=UPI0007E7CEC1|nr:chaperone protein DnaJ [Drosophila ficusphila]